MKSMMNLVKNQDYSTLFGMSLELVVSFFAGGVLLTAVMTPLTYIFVKKLVSIRQAKKKSRQENIKNGTSK